MHVEVKLLLNWNHFLHKFNFSGMHNAKSPFSLPAHPLAHDVYNIAWEITYEQG